MAPSGRKAIDHGCCNCFVITTIRRLRISADSIVMGPSGSGGDGQLMAGGARAPTPPPWGGGAGGAGCCARPDVSASAATNTTQIPAARGRTERRWMIMRATRTARSFYRQLHKRGVDTYEIDISASVKRFTLALVHGDRTADIRYTIHLPCRAEGA